MQCIECSHKDSFSCIFTRRNIAAKRLCKISFKYPLCISINQIETFSLKKREKRYKIYSFFHLYASMLHKHYNINVTNTYIIQICRIRFMQQNEYVFLMILQMIFLSISKYHQYTIHVCNRNIECILHLKNKKSRHWRIINH